MKPVFDANSPIGVLDSGIGGFSVARAVQRLLPAEQLIYFGDGAHIPYGNHPEDKIVAMARYMFSFLEQQQGKGPAGGLQHHLLRHRPVCRRGVLPHL